ncbi:unnamed protein product [Taenia asiatica]|uniref:Uncharacterized protein n=1 Tax=Taenia asiatica TaxID=60517 RepID=A0A0R3WDK9_TAEAS|nr:unnamed protein product [Taenia asiatica]
MATFDAPIKGIHVIIVSQRDIRYDIMLLLLPQAYPTTTSIEPSTTSLLAPSFTAFNAKALLTIGRLIC